MAARPTVSVYSTDATTVEKEVALPGIFLSPMRPDVVHFVTTNIAKNKRQAYAVTKNRGLKAAGMQTAAESWGTGRAVSRIPRVPGGGTHRAGQAAFGNMCRGGRMFNPTRVWRKWHRRVNLKQRRFAVASALAASAVPALVMARGHRISEVPEMPLVIGGDIEATAKTAAALKLLTAFGASADVDRCAASKKLRAGKGKMRNRRYVMRRGPLVVYKDGDTVEKAFRAISGVEVCNVSRMNLLQLAPGGHLGRFVIWTAGAFEELDKIYATEQGAAAGAKSGFNLPRTMIANADIARIINSDEVQKAVRPAKTEKPKKFQKRNPLKNFSEMVKLNPYALAHRRAEDRATKTRTKKKKNAREARRAAYASMTAE